MIYATSTHGAFNSRTDVLHSSRLFVCGGGSRCPRFENLTHTLYSPRDALGPVRCPECAERLGWL